MHVIRPTQFYKEKAKELGIKESNIISTTILNTINGKDQLKEKDKLNMY